MNILLIGFSKSGESIILLHRAIVRSNFDGLKNPQNKDVHVFLIIGHVTEPSEPFIFDFVYADHFNKYKNIPKGFGKYFLKSKNLKHRNSAQTLAETSLRSA